MSPYEASLARRVASRSRRVLELRRQLSLAERQLQEAVTALERCSERPEADQATSLAVEA